MRLSDFEIKTIKHLANQFYGQQAKVVLFGSRVDDSKKGGDIDVFIETPLETNIKDKLNFLVQLENYIGEQKVDLVVKSKNSPPKDIFNIAKSTGIVL
ncbi:MAG: nucleotidyltransferase domain-containing protein [Methylococcales bacterium]|nr:nucleotidyltransferase domain-containing protein [Methylococcales bacterium]